MSRYIDAEAVKEEFTCKGDEWINNIIDSEPSIDIVRCKECRWAEPNRQGDYDCKCHIPIFRVIADDFCSYGERGGE